MHTMRPTTLLTLGLLALVWSVNVSNQARDVEASQELETESVATSAIAPPIGRDGNLHSAQEARTRVSGAIMTPVYRLGGTSRALAVGDEYAYLGVGASVVVVDIRDPLGPAPVGHVDLQNEPTALTLRAGQLFAVASPTVYALAVADPSHPRVIATYTSPINLAPVIALHGDYAYVVTQVAVFRDDYCRLLILDASEPPSLAPLTEHDTVCPRQMLVSDGLAFLSYWAGGAMGTSSRGAIRLFDLADPLRPTNIADTPVSNEVIGMHVADGYLYAAVDGPSGTEPIEEQGGVRVFNLRWPWAPRLVGALSTEARIEGMVVAGERAYLRELQGTWLDGERSELLVSLSSPSYPESLGPVELPIDFHAAASHRYRVLAAALHGGLDSYDVGTKAEPKELPGLDVPAGAVDVALSDTALVVPTGFEGDASPADSVVLTSRPATRQPVVLGGWDCPGTSVAAAHGTTAYLGTSWGLQSVDLADPTAPAELGRLEHDWSPSRMILRDDQLYLNTDDGLYTVDIADPTKPTIVGLTSPAAAAPCEGGGLALEGCTAAAAWGKAGLALFDVCQDGPAVLVERFSLPDDEGEEPLRFVDVALAGDVAYVAADDTSGITSDFALVLDVSSPETIVELGRLQMDGKANGLLASGSRVFVAGASLLPGDSIGRVWAINVSDPTAPALEERLTVPGRPSRLLVDGDDLYVASGTSGLHALRLTPTDFTPAHAVHLPFAGSAFAVAQLP